MGRKDGHGQRQVGDSSTEDRLSPIETKRLGLDRPITRRDSVKAMMVGAGSLVIPGCRGSSNALPPGPVTQSSPTSSLSPRSFFAGDTEESFRACHRFIDGERFDKGAEDTGEILDLVIVGAGLGGLTAAYFYHQRRPEERILLLDNHADFGGDAQRNEMTVKGQNIIVTQACDYQWDPEYRPVRKLWADLGIDLSPTSDLALPPEAYHEHMFVNGDWVKDFWETGYRSPASPFSKKVQRHYDAFWDSMETFEWEPWPQVKAALAEWDKISFKEWMEEVEGWDPQLTHLIDMMVRSDYGAGADTLSAACGFWNFTGGEFVRYKFPGGLSGLARHLVNALIPGAWNGRDVITGDIDRAALDSSEHNVRIRLNSTAVDVRHEGSPEESDYVRIKYVEGDRLRRLKARSVIMAGGGYMTKHVVSDLPEEQRAAYGSFHYAAYALVNVWINNSRALDRLGFGYSGWIWEPRLACYLTVADGITAAGHDPNRDPERPNCITLWCPQLPDPALDGDHETQCKRAQAEMLNRTFEEYEVLARQELLDVFGAAGFDPAEDIEGIAVNRFGHAEVVCYPGFAFRSGSPRAPRPGTPIYDAGRRFGRVAFAHTDLHGFADNQGTTMVSWRAVNDLLE